MVIKMVIKMIVKMVGQDKNHEDYDDCNKDAEEVEDVFDRRQITNRSNANWQFRLGYTKKLNVFREYILPADQSLQEVVSAAGCSPSPVENLQSHIRWPF